MGIVGKSLSRASARATRDHHLCLFSIDASNPQSLQNPSDMDLTLLISATIAFIIACGLLKVEQLMQAL